VGSIPAGEASVNKLFIDEVLKRNKNLIVSSANKYKDYAILY
jgi:hypothetical protein